VHLDVLNPVHISDPILANKMAGGGVFVTYPKVAADDATVSIKTDVANDSALPKNCEVSHELVGPDGVAVGKAAAPCVLPAGSSSDVSQQIDVPSPMLWNPNHPYLYVLHTVISVEGKRVDDVYTRIGIRSIRFDAATGLYINGEHFVSIGANRHQDHPYVGYALPDSAQYRDVKLLRDANFTSYRSHYPMDQAWMDACDQFGVLAIVSNPGWQFMGDDLFKQRVYQDCRDMIRWNRNHPSVVLWEAEMNETDDRPVAPTLYKIVHEEYPGDQAYASGNHIDPMADFPGWDVEYSGGVPSKPNWWREWGDQVDNWGDQQSSSRVDRSWGETPMLVQAWAHTQRLDSVLSAAQPKEGGQYGWLTGADLWAGIDCYRGYHRQPFLGGPIDLFRIPKFDYYMFQSQRPAKDLNIPGVDGGPMVYVANFATSYSPTTVTVYSNCDQVRLSENGKVIATQSPDPGHVMPHPPFTFQIGQLNAEHSMLYSTGVARPGTVAGEITAEGLIGGRVVATFDVKSPGVPTHVELTADLDGKDLTANGSDWVRVYARICDSRGTVYPFASDQVTFTVAGPGSVIGDASIGANPTAARAGIATALIQASTVPGDIVVTASAFGLTDGTVTIRSVPNPIPVWP
jgi:beta-galactosidase